MGMTEQQEQIAKEVADGLASSSVEKSLLICGIERFLAVLPKQSQVGYFVQNYVAGAGFRWEQVDSTEGARALYLEAPIAPPASEQKPVELPPLPQYIAKGNLGVCYYDGLQMHQYAIRYAELCSTSPRPDYKAQRDALLDSLREIDRHMEEAGFNVGGPIEHCHDEISHAEAMRLLSLAQEYMKDVSRLAGRAIASAKGGE